MNKKILIGSIITICILVGVSFTSVVGYNNVEGGVKENKVIIDSKELLFNTIIEISNNPEFKELIRNNGQNLIPTNFEIKEIYSQFPKHKSIYSFYKPTLSKDYLQVIYEYGCEIINILGEEKVSELIASLEFKNNEILTELNNIIKNDEELKNNIHNLKKSNVEILSITEFWDAPVICGILLIITIAMIIINNILAIPVEIIFFRLLEIPKDSKLGKIIIDIFSLLTMPFTIIGLSTGILYIVWFDCFPDIPYSRYI